LKRCTKVTAPVSPPSIPCANACSRCQRPISSTNIRACAVSASGDNASTRRTSNGAVNTHCLTGTSGSTSSTKCAAVAHARRAPQLGHVALHLHAYATSISRWHVAHATRKKPCARMPQRR